MSDPGPAYADRYARALSAAETSTVAAEPEAQLTVPVHDLLVAAAGDAGLGELRLIREAQLPGVRPDFAALIVGTPCGWVELKAPGHTLDGPSWRGREAKQWAILAALDALIVCNGTTARLYLTGEQAGLDVTLPADGATGWDPGPLADLLRLFVTARPRPITRVSQLADRLAPLTRMLKERVAAGLTKTTPRAPVKEAWVAWRHHVHEQATAAEFANDLAQVVGYSLAITALRGGADTDQDGRITLEEARQALAGQNAVLAAALGPALRVRGLRTELAAELGAIERLAAAVDPQAVARSHDTRGEAWLWFYEDFLATYDPEARKKTGVYYTPIDVVQCQVRLCDHILTQALGKRLSFGDPSVVTLDPATGSGTYPLAVLDQAEAVARQERGPAGPRQVSGSLAQHVLAFELLPGPYAVAHLRIGQRLAELAETLTPPEHVRVYLTDTLDDPDAAVPTLGLWGDEGVLAEERARAAGVKKTEPVTVVVGNPPYARRTRESGGGWVLHPANGRSLFTDLIEPAQQSGVIFAAQASLYNDYVYFWRWALWKAFQQDQDRPAVVSLITASSWLTGPAFTGLRALARNLADEIWIIDLGGEGRGATKDENVFAIQTPVAIVTLYRKGTTTQEPATVRYRRVTGTASEKLATLATVQPPREDPAAWTALPTGREGDPLIAHDESTTGWAQMPALTDLFPWQQPGAMYNRAWPIAPSPGVLTRRWQAFLAKTDATERAALFVTGSSGRTIHTHVGGYRHTLSQLPPGAAHEPIARYGFRSFDRQYTFTDARLAKTESPSLWASWSEDQLFLTTLTTSPLGEGPALTVTTAPPDKHHFHGRGGKDVIPLYRDQQATAANLPAGLLHVLAERYHEQVTPEDLAAYVYAAMAHPGYTELFAQELRQPGPRVPLTADPDLFWQGVHLGRHLLWLHTFTERYRDPDQDRADRLPSVPGLSWVRAVSEIPADPDQIDYHPETRTLTVGTGAVSEVPPGVWDFTISGFPVLKRWLGSRTARGVGRASGPKTATPLDRIRPTEWEDTWNDELLDLLRVLTLSLSHHKAQADLLGRIAAGPLIPASELPLPTAAERAVPGARTRR